MTVENKSQYPINRSVLNSHNETAVNNLTNSGPVSSMFAANDNNVKNPLSKSADLSEKKVSTIKNQPQNTLSKSGSILELMNFLDNKALSQPALEPSPAPKKEKINLDNEYAKIKLSPRPPRKSTPIAPEISSLTEKLDKEVLEKAIPEYLPQEETAFGKDIITRKEGKINFKKIKSDKDDSNEKKDEPIIEDDKIILTKNGYKITITLKEEIIAQAKQTMEQQPDEGNLGKFQNSITRVQGLFISGKQDPKNGNSAEGIIPIRQAAICIALNHALTKNIKEDVKQFLETQKNSVFTQLDRQLIKLMPEIGITSSRASLFNLKALSSEKSEIRNKDDQSKFRCSLDLITVEAAKKTLKSQTSSLRKSVWAANNNDVYIDLKKTKKALKDNLSKTIDEEDLRELTKSLIYQYKSHSYNRFVNLIEIHKRFINRLREGLQLIPDTAQRGKAVAIITNIMSPENALLDSEEHRKKQGEHTKSSKASHEKPNPLSKFEENPQEFTQFDFAHVIPFPSIFQRKIAQEYLRKFIKSQQETTPSEQTITWGVEDLHLAKSYSKKTGKDEKDVIVKDGIKNIFEHHKNNNNSEQTITLGIEDLHLAKSYSKKTGEDEKDVIVKDDIKNIFEHYKNNNNIELYSGYLLDYCLHLSLEESSVTVHFPKIFNQDLDAISETGVTIDPSDVELQRSFVEFKNDNAHVSKLNNLIEERNEKRKNLNKSLRKENKPIIPLLKPFEKPSQKQFKFILSNNLHNLLSDETKNVNPKGIESAINFNEMVKEYKNYLFGVKQSIAREIITVLKNEKSVDLPKNKIKVLSLINIFFQIKNAESKAQLDLSEGDKEVIDAASGIHQWLDAKS